MPNVAAVAVTARGAALGLELAAARIVSEVWATPAVAAVAGPGVGVFSGSTASGVAELFGRVTGLVCFMAVGAAVRLVAPCLGSKQTDPAVVAVDERALHAVSVLGGHEGGANDLATRVADLLGARPVITTASDVLGVESVAQVARRLGLRLEGGDAAVRRAATAAVQGVPIRLTVDAGLEGWRASLPAEWRTECLDPSFLSLSLSDRDPIAPETPDGLIVRPPSLILGVGCSLGAPVDELRDLALGALARAGLSPRSVAGVATIDRRASEPCVVALASQLDCPIVTHSAAALAAVDGLPGASDVVRAAVGTPGVCEPAAVLATGGSLVVDKQKSAHCTVAVARRPSPPARWGRLAIVGIGPGADDLLPPAARTELREADAIVGYRGYVDQLRHTFPAGRFEPYELGEERERCARAIALARAGSRVALVSSGDAGVYGMAGLALELVGVTDDVDVVVVPGITAALAAAARLGAPLMLDYACINLSDILVPWERIEARLRALAASDIALALYNPASARRRQPLARALELLRAHRSSETPVGVVRDAYRDGESVAITTLGALDPAIVDMRTILIVGGSEAVKIGSRLVARRGYRDDHA
ncbi:MAG: precorrin-3B C(17)-methyltransferase [Chloroflexota bacterium]